MTGVPQSVVVVDPMADLAEVLGSVEEWAGWAEPRTFDESGRLEAAAAGAQALAAAIRTESRAVFTADGVELATIAVISGMLGGALRSVRDGVAQATDTPTPSGAGRAIDLLTGCWRYARTGRARNLVAIVRATPPGDGVVLDRQTSIAYRRLVSAVVTDPLERFVAIPLPSPSRAAEPGLGL